MDTRDKGWFKGLKDSYKPEDVIRYFEEVNRIKSSPDTGVHPPEYFFHPETLEKGLLLLKNKRIKYLQDKLWYLKNVKIERIENELKELAL